MTAKFCVRTNGYSRVPIYASGGASATVTSRVRGVRACLTYHATGVRHLGDRDSCGVHIGRCSKRACVSRLGRPRVLHVSPQLVGCRAGSSIAGPPPSNLPRTNGRHAQRPVARGSSPSRIRASRRGCRSEDERKVLPVTSPGRRRRYAVRSPANAQMTATTSANHYRGNVQCTSQEPPSLRGYLTCCGRSAARRERAMDRDWRAWSA